MASTTLARFVRVYALVCISAVDTDLFGKISNLFIFPLYSPNVEQLVRAQDNITQFWGKNTNAGSARMPCLNAF